MGITRQPARFGAAAFAILAGMAMVPSAYAEGLIAEFIRTAPLEKEELFNQTVLWVVESFGSARPIIRVQNRDLGLIIGKGTFDMAISDDRLPFTPVNLPVRYELRIHVRDHRYRMSFSDVELPPDGIPRSVYYSDRYSDERRVHEYFEQLANGLDRHLANGDKDF